MYVAPGFKYVVTYQVVVDIELIKILYIKCSPHNHNTNYNQATNVNC